MSRALQIDFVAPPYAGHLFPLLDLGMRLEARGYMNLRVLSTADAHRATQLSGLAHVPLLAGQEARVKAIANTGAPVALNPFRMYRQFQMSMTLMGELAAQLRQVWSERRPDVVIADFTVPIAGLVATQLGIRWWTSTPSPCALESKTGTPAYLGGWMPATGPLTRLRDAVGRRVIRLFKLGVARLFARQLRQLGFPGVYRDDGYEAIYSRERIFGLGMREFEFEQDWPAAFEFIGPLPGCPPFPSAPPEFPEGKRAILVTLGTHLPWARQRAAELMQRVAARMPDCVFHFAQGSPGSTTVSRQGNFHVYGFIPYHEHLSRYAAAVVHGGTGILYQCIQAGVPMLVWPHDFDHYDHAARIVHRGLGMEFKPTVRDVCGDLRALLTGDGVRARLREFQAHLKRYDPCGTVMAALQPLAA